MRRLKALSFRLSLWVLILPCTATLFGQTSGDGVAPFSALQNFGTDAINLQTLGIIITAPIRSKVGAIPFAYSLIGNSNCQPEIGGYYLACGMATRKKSAAVAGWWNFTNVVGGIVGAALTFQVTDTTCENKADVKYTNFAVVTPDGTAHPLPAGDVVDSLGCINKSFTDETTDNSGFTVLNVTYSGGGTLYDASGNYVPVVLNGYDSYGNLVSSTEKDVYSNSLAASNTSGTVWTYSDTLGVTPITATLPYASPADGPINSGGTYIWTDINSGNQEVSETFTPATLKTDFGCLNIKDGSSSASLLTQLSYPDGSNMQFTYESTPNGSSGEYTGRIQQITLRTGGTIAYGYSGGSNNGINCTTYIPPTMTRTTSQGTWTYTNAAGTSTSTTTVIDPGGNKTIYTFNSLLLTQVQEYLNTNTVSKPKYASVADTTDVYCYNAASGQPGNCPSAGSGYPVTEVDVYHTIGGMTKSSRTQKTFDAYGNVLVSARYDFGATVPTYTTTNTYGSWGGSSCSGTQLNANYIFNKVCESKVTDSASNTLSDARFTYDAKGDMLTKSEWNGTTWLNATATYNTNGTVATSTNVSGVQTVNTYGNCNGFLLTKAVVASTLTTQESWYCAGGVPHTTTDANSNVTSYGYVNQSGVAEPFWRLSSVTDPLNNETWTKYSPNSKESIFSFGSSTQDTTTTVDGLGRSSLAQTLQGPGATQYDTVSKTYSWGVNSSVLTTVPCSQSIGAGCGSTGVTVTSDPLGRVVTSVDGGGGTVTDTYTQNDTVATLSPAPSGENPKSVQTQVDGLGRAQLLCAILSSGGTSCGQNTGTSSGIVTSYTYTDGSGTIQTKMTRGSQSRSKTVDALGRVISVTTPEAGTVTSVYDTGGCGGTSWPGLLTSTTLANGDGVCYLYDGLGRVTSEASGGGSAAICRRFGYDNTSGVLGTIPPGITVANSYGRLAEAETDNCTWPITSSTIITDEWFSYDADGRVTDMWEMTPHSGTYYHSMATFFANGVLNTVQLANPSLYTATFGVEGEGRPSTLEQGSKWIVSGLSYNAASQPTNIFLGNNDSDTYSYDPNTGRMNTYWLTVGESLASEIGYPTWNTNGTLQGLTITDGFNAGGNQTETFTYDDIGRLVNDSSGSTWAQQFSYDIYDNITKTGSGNWACTPCYNAANNQYNSMMGTVSYDNSGNLLTDPVGHAYTWNPLDQLASVDSTACGTNGECATYDALGKLVEVSNGSAYTEIWYTQAAKVFINGSTIKYAYWPTPAGGTLMEAGNGGTYYYQHKDWLGRAPIISKLTSSGSVYGDYAFAPYGEIYDTFGTVALDQENFTGDTLDLGVATMFHTDNRELNALEGRWISPDPAGAGWNLYAYGTDPNGGIDPSGLIFGDPVITAIEWNQGDGWGDFACSLDGVGTGCNLLASALRGGGVAPCLNNDCGGYGTQWKLSLNGADYMWLAGSTSSWQENPSWNPQDPNSLSGLFDRSVLWEDLGPIPSLSGLMYNAANNGVPQNNSPNGTLSKIVDTFSRVTHPLDLMAVNASFFLGGGGAVIAGGAAIGLGCAEPTPAEPLTCAAGIAGGAPTIVGGTLLLQEGVNFFKTYTLPAIENWGSD